MTMLDVANVPSLGFGEQEDSDATGIFDDLKV
jgi:hypothetical protein